MVGVGRWWKETALVLFFRTFDFLLFQIIFNQKEPLNFFLLLFQIILNQKELFFKKGTNGKVWYIASIFRCDSVSQQLPPSLPILPILLILANTTNPANPCQSCRSYQSLPIRPCKGDHFFSEFVLLLSHSIVQLSHLPSFVSLFQYSQLV